jgi:hypothetical protein
MADLETELRCARQDLRKSQRHRDDAIARASKAGMSRRAVAAAVGLTVGRVQQIVDADRGRKR